MQKTERLGLVLTPTEKATVVQLAEAEGGLSLAALVRRLIREAACERGLWPPSGNGQPSYAREVGRERV